MPLANDLPAVQFPGQRPFTQPAVLAAKPHGTAHIGLLVALVYRARGVTPFRDQADHTVRCFRIDLSRVGFLQPADIPCEFDRSRLHAIADSQVGNAVFPGMPDRIDLAFKTTFTESAGHQYGIDAIE